MSSTMERVIKRLERGEKTRILAFGSSNTEHFLPGIHWVECLGIGLKEKYGAISTLINTGIGGHTSRDLLHRFEADAAFYQPHVAVITIGGNDSSPDKNISPADFEANLLELYHRFVEMGTEVIYQTYYAPNVADLQPQRYENFRLYSDVVRKVAAQTGAHMVDHLKRWEPLRDRYLEKYLPLMHDGFHLNSRGNRVMGVDLTRHFNAPLNYHTYDYWGEALVIQKLMDQLEMESV